MWIDGWVGAFVMEGGWIFPISASVGGRFGNSIFHEST